MGLALALGLGSGGSLGMLRVPQALEEAPRFSSPSQETCFPFGLGKAGPIPSFSFRFFFLRALEDNARLQSWVEVPG